MTITNGHTPDVPSVRDMRKRARTGAQGSPFTPWEAGRLFSAYGGGAVFDTPFQVRELERMLEQDGSAAEAERLLRQAVKTAGWEVRAAPGDRGEAEYVREHLGRVIGPLIKRCTMAFSRRKTFHELVWDVSDGVQLADVALRPVTSCTQEWRRDGHPDGFRQTVPFEHGRQDQRFPGTVKIDELASFVYIHGRDTEPLHGTSDLTVTHNLWTKKNKLLFLLLQFLEQQTSPRIGAYGDTDTEAGENADMIAETVGGGVFPITRPQNADPGARLFELIESSGKGASEFLTTLRWFDEQGKNSLLMGFMGMTSQAAGTRGSYGMVSDLRDVFQASQQEAADDMAAQIVEGPIRKATLLAFGAEAKIPSLSIGPLSKDSANVALEMLSSISTATTVNIPPGVVDLLWTQCAGKLGLDVDQVREAVESWRAAEQDDGDAEQGSDGDAMQLAHTIDAVYGLTNDALAGVDPHDALEQRLELARKVRTPAGAKRYGKPIGSPISGRTAPRSSTSRAAARSGPVDTSSGSASSGLADALQRASVTGRRRYVHVDDNGTTTVGTARRPLSDGGTHYIVHADGSVFTRSGGDEGGDETLTPLSDADLHDRVGAIVGDDDLPDGSLADQASRVRKLSDAEIDAAMTRAIELDNMDAFELFAAESDRRDTNRAKRAAAKERDQERRAARYEQLLEQGATDEDAIEDAYGVPRERQRRLQAEQLLRQAGYSGGFTAASRAAFRDEAYQRFMAAEDATRGELRNMLGERKNISPLSLFTGPESRVRKYGSEELREHLDEVGRLTYDEFVFGLLRGRNSGTITSDFYA